MSMDDNKVKEKLRKEGLAVFNKAVGWTDISREYPHCRTVSESIRKRIIDSDEDLLCDIGGENITLKELVIGEGYRHYVLLVTIEQEKYIIDGTFGQFAEEKKYSPDVAPENQINDVIVTKAQRYIFFRNIV